MAPPRMLTVALMASALLVAGCSSSSSGSGSTTKTAPARSNTTPSTRSAQASGSKGCDVEPPAGGRTEQTLSSGGRDRTYVRYVSKNATPEVPSPLILDLTAYSPASMEEGFSGFTKANADGDIPAERALAVVVTPEPVNGEGLLTWNITGTTSSWTDDQQFLVDLLDGVEATSCIDTGQVLVTGFAIGGVMASAFACEHADRVSALATVSGLWDPPGCKPSRPVPVISFHGDEDHFLPYGGGVGDRVGMLSLSPETTDGLVSMASRDGAVASSAAWAKHNGCGDEPKQSAVADGSSTRTWQGCDADVELVTVDGGSHTWPGSTGMSAFESLLGPVSPKPDATSDILGFLVRHRSP